MPTQRLISESASLVKGTVSTKRQCLLLPKRSQFWRLQKSERYFEGWTKQSQKRETNMKATGILHRACPCVIIGKTEEHWRNTGVFLILSVFRHRKFVMIDSAIPNPRRYIRITFPNICHRISRTAAVTTSGRFYTHILARSLVGSYSLANTGVHEKCQTVSSKLVWQHKWIRLLPTWRFSRLSAWVLPSMCWAPLSRTLLPVMTTSPIPSAALPSCVKWLPPSIWLCPIWRMWSRALSPPGSQPMLRTSPKRSPTHGIWMTKWPTQEGPSTGRSGGCTPSIRKPPSPSGTAVPRSTALHAFLLCKAVTWGLVMGNKHAGQCLENWYKTTAGAFQMRTGCLHTILKITDTVCYFQDIVAWYESSKHRLENVAALRLHSWK